MDVVDRRRQLEAQQQEIARQLRQLEEDERNSSTRIPINSARSGMTTPLGRETRRSSVLGTPSPSARAVSPAFSTGRSPSVASEAAPLPPLTAAPLLPVALRPGHEEYRATDGTEVQRVDHAGPENVTERWYTSPDGNLKEYERHLSAPGREEHMRDEESHFATPNSETWNKVQSHSSSYVGGGSGSPPAAMMVPLMGGHNDALRFHQQQVDAAMKQAQEQMNWATQHTGALSHAAFPAFAGAGNAMMGGSVADIHARAVRDAERSMQDMMRRSQEQMQQMMRSACVPSPSYCGY